GHALPVHVQCLDLDSQASQRERPRRRLGAPAAERDVSRARHRPPPPAAVSPFSLRPPPPTPQPPEEPRRTARSLSTAVIVSRPPARSAQFVRAADPETDPFARRESRCIETRLVCAVTRS